MNRNRLSILVCLLVSCVFGLAAACGGGSGGGGTTPTATPTATATTAFGQADLAGTWSWTAGTITGKMVFNSAGTMQYIIIESCSYTSYSVTSWVDNSYSTYAYNLFIHTDGYCYDEAELLKFALNTSTDKKSATGILDRHYNGDGGGYTRYSCTMTKDE